jgi:hypothetical protein
MELMDQGQRHLAMAVGAAVQGTAMTRILAMKSSPGWITRGSEIREWRFEGVKEMDGTLYLHGPHASGTMLADVIALPLARALPYLVRLAHALSVLAGNRKEWFPLETDAVLFTDDESVLFLPPEIHREIRDLRTFEANRDTYESLNHPDLKGELLASFGIASILYRVVTGRFAVTGPNAEEIHEQARKLAIMPPNRLAPEIAPEVSELIMAGLGRAKRGPVTIAEWAKRLVEWQSQELFLTLSAEDRARALSDAEAREKGSTQSFRRRMFWEKNWKLVAIIAAAVIAVGAVFGSILSNALAPRVTRGYAPDKVVQTFYVSMNVLDHMTMQACVIGKAGQGEINEATTLYVTSRVTQGYEGRSNIVAASEWDKAGRPVLTSPQTLYGVTGLSLRREQDGTAPVFLVKYDKWSPSSAPDTGKMPSLDAVPQSEGHSVVDRAWLKQDKGDWVIYRIDRLSADLLPAPQSVAATATNDPNNPAMGTR